VERFSERARNVVASAEDEARQLAHPHVGTEHLLLGLIAVDGPAAAALRSAGATQDATRDKVAEAVGRAGAGGHGERDFSPRARRALERASRLSLHRRDAHVEPEHLLLGVLDVEGRAGQVLRGLGVDVTALRETTDLRSGDGGTTMSPGRSLPAPQCAVCGTALDGALSYRVVPAAGAAGARLTDHRDFVIAYCSSCGAALGAAPA
jgi:ATP-dependent Clp protease ATP-binding subunit ClpA